MYKCIECFNVLKHCLLIVLTPILGKLLYGWDALTKCRRMAQCNTVEKKYIYNVKNKCRYLYLHIYIGDNTWDSCFIFLNSWSLCNKKNSEKKITCETTLKKLIICWLCMLLSIGAQTTSSSLQCNSQHF